MPNPGIAIGGASSLLGASSARRAQRSQEQAAQQQLDLQERIYDETVQRFDPYTQSGVDFQNALRFELLGGDRPMFGAQTPQITEEQFQMEPVLRDTRNGAEGAGGISGSPYAPAQTGTRYNVNGQTLDTRDAAEGYANANRTGGTEYQGFQATPGYDWQLQQGQNAIDNSAASSGNLFSGATQRSQMRYVQGMANQEYNNFLNRLTGGAASGQAAAGNQANAGANYASGAGTALANMGNAGAAGAIGVGNALQTGLSNGVGLWNYQNQPGSGGNNANIFSAPWASGGFWG